MILPIIAGVVAAGAGILGAVGQRQDAARAASDQNKYNELTAELTYQQQLRERSAEIVNAENALALAMAKAKQEVAIAQATANQEWQFNSAVQRFNTIRERTSSELEWQYRTAAQNMDWQLQQTLQDAEYRAQIRAFEQGEKTYAALLQLNSQAAGLAYEGAQVQLRVAQMSSIMEADNLRRETTKQQGAIAASGRSGGSMARLQMDAQQQYANDLGTLATNLTFAKSDYSSATSDAWLAQISANNEADSRRMLRPMDKINIPRPVDIPKAYIPDPPDIPKPMINEVKPITATKVIRPPMPTKGPVPIARAPSTLGTIASIGGSILSGYQTYASLAPPKPTG